ncbi:SHOCT domain-containing protein [Streptomyces roseus]|uniref:SHOCT domain-containing protein n=1 Tax=Streptomyces roseus TaxID=66430 RepID=UPI0037FAE66C
MPGLGAAGDPDCRWPALGRRLRPPGRCAMYWNGHGMGAWGWFAMSLTTLIVWTLIVAATVLVVRALRRDGADDHRATAPYRASDRGAERLLAERFARGEIDDEEYSRRLAVLRSHASGPTPL